MVPLGNVAFSFHFMPSHEDLKSTDIIGLFTIMLGLILYRFAGNVPSQKPKHHLFTEKLLDTQQLLDSETLP